MLLFDSELQHSFIMIFYSYISLTQSKINSNVIVK